MLILKKKNTFFFQFMCKNFRKHNILKPVL